MDEKIDVGRKKKVANNTKFNIIKYLFQLILQFVVRTIIIKYLGENYLGINGLFTSIVGMLNLAELGIGTAIVFSMYKPVAENDTEKICALFTLYKKIYLIISLVVLVVGTGLIPFLKYFITGSVKELDINFYVIYIMFLLNTLLSYMAGHRKSLLFVYQRNDIETKVKTLGLLGLNISQIIVLVLFKNFYVYAILMPVFTLLENLLIYLATKKMYPEIKSVKTKLPQDTMKEIKRNVFAMSMHKIGGVVVSSTDNLIISSIIGTVIVGVYSNYQMIISAIASFLTLGILSLKGSVGNLMVTSDKQHVMGIYKKINWFFSWLSGFCAICLFCLLQPFILLWTGSEVYILDIYVVLILCVQFYITSMRYTTSMFNDCAGLMWNDRWKPVVESIVNLVVSIILAKQIGLIGVFIGTTVSTLSAPIWVEPLILHRDYFKVSTKGYWKRYIINALITISIGALTYFVCSLLKGVSVWMLLAKGLICLILPNALYALCYFKTEEFKYFKDLFADFFKSKFKKKG